MSYRTPTPDDCYLSLLGRAAYTWAYTEWGLIYAVRWATGQDLSGLAGQTGGGIVGAFADMVQAQQEAHRPMYIGQPQRAATSWCSSIVAATTSCMLVQ